LLGSSGLDIDGLDRNSNRLFDPVGKVAPFRRPWAICRWA
jgi:hypothetical protein